MPKKPKAYYPLNQSPFFKLATKRKLSELLGLTERQLRKLASSNTSYCEWDAVNEKGKVRRIEHPKPRLKRIQARIAALLSRISPPGFLFCPVKGRSYISNAQAHSSSAVVRTLDIKKFFPSTPSRRVYWFFNSWMECSTDVAGILTALSTFQGRLPTGSPLSPIMAYFAHVDMWEEIGEIANAANCNITVYIDDVTLSGPTVPDRVFWAIKRVIHRCGLRYHKEKAYVGRKKEVTGVVIVDGKLRAPNRQHLKIHELRQTLQRSSDLEQAAAIKQKLQGRIAQVNQIRKLAEKY